ncbi:MAG: (Fe-S)-binding protein [Gammaproteobacteria bacterium]|nr:(Fe-S)-binding protein [Gammaproteobacteria bacterium]
MSTAPAFPLADADRCVKCGLCLPHCPTYAEARHEGDSPRGRIALMQGLATGLVPQTAALEAHLDGCLTCRACEPVCPAQVPYGRLIDAGRELLARQRPRRTRAARVLALFLTRPWMRTPWLWLLWSYRALGVQALVRRFRLLGRGRLARLESLLPAVTPAALPVRTTAAPKEQVALFANCTSPWAERETLNAALRLLERSGFAAAIPPGQRCCGALHRHAGLPAPADGFARANLDAFAGYRHIVGIASGCTAELLEYGARTPHSAAAEFSARVQDIHAFLLRHGAALRFRPLAARVAVHTPCTLRNVVGNAGAVSALLKKIPQLEAIELDPSQRCCGAAGSAMLLQADMADRLARHKTDAARRLTPDLIVSANVGCSLHLAGALRREGSTVEVLHPVVLLARQLEPA